MRIDNFIRGNKKMGFDWKKFAQIAELVAPIVIPIVSPRLAPLGTVIGHAMGEAESIPDANGPDKLNHVKRIANDAANAVNVASNKTVIDPNGLNEAVEHGINTTVAVVNLINKAKQPSNIAGQPVS
jgi:hypothetical protein